MPKKSWMRRNGWILILAVALFVLGLTTQRARSDSCYEARDKIYTSALGRFHDHVSDKPTVNAEDPKVKQLSVAVTDAFIERNDCLRPKAQMSAGQEKPIAAGN